MSKFKAALALVNDLRSLANNVEVLVGVLEENQTDLVLPVQAIPPKPKPKIKPNSPAEEKGETPEQKQPTLEEVRAVMAAKNRDGHREAVKAILFKHGANKLTALDPKYYTEALKEVEEIK